ncbi:ATP-binding protein [Rheinheimera salexigens]|uniref:histidine kinase n=1 Tax=Rheinheimera salexigens TaxID=1628148 RepID=A0A1E7Q982_9GAMM|nr:ATP-binding protein [Rheinheimera salexigens]OEY70696.1 hypothetical protein BI198_14845 [Rheinheimera salexigens]
MNKSLQQILLDISLDPKIDQGNLHTAGQLILTTLKQQLQVDSLSIWLHNAKGNQIDCLCLFDLNLFETPSSLSLHSQDFPLYFNALNNLQSPAIFDPSTNQPTSELYQHYFKPLGLGTIVEAPVRNHGKAVGIIRIEHQQAKHWTDAEIMFITVFADILGRAINAAERLDYQQQLTQFNSQLEQKVLQRTKKLTQSLAELKNAQHKMIEVEKMASLGRMVAGISHEINTPLGIAVTANSHAQATLAELEALYLSGQLTKSLFSQRGEAMKSSIHLVTNNLQRTVDLVESIKQTALEPSASAPVWLKLDPFISQVIASLAYEIASCQLQVVVDIPPGAQIQTHSSALATILRQLIENTCLHAFTEQTNRTLHLSIALHDAVWCLTLSDNGHGMTEKHLSRAFEPFFTSNRSGGSKGLGLTLVFNLVTQILQGQIQLDSIDNGFRVHITCPRFLVMDVK